MFQFLGQKKKEEAEERRNKLKKAREDYKKMLEVRCLLVLGISSYFIYIQFSLSLSLPLIYLEHNFRSLQS
jgi:hypothetical protein